MKTALIICLLIVAAAIVAYAIMSLEKQELSLRLILPKYPTLNTKDAEKVDKKILIDAIDQLNRQYEHTESVYKKALKARKSIIHILIITLISEVALLSIILVVLIRKVHVKDKPSTQQAT